MSNFIFLLFFVPLLASILLLINFLLAPHVPNKNKDSQFECGFSSFIQMSRLPFTISFFLFGLLFLLFDIEITLAFPFVVSSYGNSIYGFITLETFFLLLVVGFLFELGKKALDFNTKESKISPGQDSYKSIFTNNNTITQVRYYSNYKDISRPRAVTRSKFTYTS